MFFMRNIGFQRDIEAVLISFSLVSSGKSLNVPHQQQQYSFVQVGSLLSPYKTFAKPKR